MASTANRLCEIRIARDLSHPAFVSHRDDFIANPGFMPFSIFTENSLLKASLRVLDSSAFEYLFVLKYVIFVIIIIFKPIYVITAFH